MTKPYTTDAMLNHYIEVISSHHHLCWQGTNVERVFGLRTVDIPDMFASMVGHHKCHYRIVDYRAELRGESSQSYSDDLSVFLPSYPESHPCC